MAAAQVFSYDSIAELRSGGAPSPGVDVVYVAGYSGADTPGGGIQLFQGLSRANNAQLPTLQPGGNGSADATAYWITTDQNGGSSPRQHDNMQQLNGALALGESSAQGSAAEAALGLSSLSIFNGSSEHMILGDSTYIWAINIEAQTGNLRMYRRDNGGDVEADEVNSLGSYQVNGTQVVGPQLTGWAPNIGIGNQSSQSTFVAPPLDPAYSQMQAQTVANEVQILSQQIKAIKDALFAHGLIGS